MTMELLWNPVIKKAVCDDNTVVYVGSLCCERPASLPLDDGAIYKTKPVKPDLTISNKHYITRNLCSLIENGGFFVWNYYGILITRQP